jgi:autotransporter-associated beta strand protein
VAALAFGVILATAGFASAAQAQSGGGTLTFSSGATLINSGTSIVFAVPTQNYVWVGTGSTSNTGDYNLGTNWSNPPTGAPPVATSQAAVFDTTGSTAVNVSTGPIAPASWTFTANSQAYVISGADVKFGLPGATGGIIDNASSAQISISNNIGESVAGVQVQQLGNGTLILSGTNTYTGGTIINTGILRVTNNSSVGTGTVTLQDGLFQAGADGLTFTNTFKIDKTPAANSGIDAMGFSLTIAGNIADGNGAGHLLVVDSVGGGVVILTGTNTYTGGTEICGCGTLQLGTLATSGSIVGPIVNDGGFFNVVNANTTGITSITNNGGEIAFSNATSASTAHITNNGGGIFFLDASSAGSANITNRAGGTIFFGTPVPGSTDTSTAGNATIDNNNAGVIFSALTNAGTAQITNHNGGGIEFFDSSSAASAVIINNNNGFTSFGQPFGTDAPTAGHATITNNSGGETAFNAFSTAGNAVITTNRGGSVNFFDNATGGNAQFITNGTGIVDFSASLGPNGDGRVTAGSIAGSGTYYIGAGVTLTVGSNNLSTTVSGVIADFDPSPPCGCPAGPMGPGSLEKVGTGTLTLSGTNTYTGTTTVFGGVLDVEGSIASSVLTTVNAGGALTGAGTVGNTTIATGGIFLPGTGTPGSSMTVAGNLAFQSGALYLVQINSVTSTFANVTGAATLAGTVGASFAPGSTVMKQYMILSFAGGRSGAFDGAGVIGASGGLVTTVSYDPNHAYLNFALNFGATPGLNINQQRVGAALTNFFNANGGIPVAFATLAPSGLTQVSGELATGTQQATFDAMNLFMGLLTDPFINGRGNTGAGGTSATPFAAEDDTASAYAAKKSDAARDAFAKFPTKADAARNDLFDARWSVWGASYGGGSSTNGNAALGSNSSTARAFGIVAGADYRISPVTLAGFALAGGGTNFSVNGFGTGRSDLFQAGAFVRHTVGSAYVTGGLAYGWQQVTTDRTVTVAGLDQLHAQFNANAFSGRIEGGNRYVTPWMGITPYAAGQFTTYSLPAYAEQALAGTGAFALSYAAKDVTDARTELGVRTDRSFAMQDGILTLRGRFAWAHDFYTDRNISAVFQTLPGASFVVNGAAQAHDSTLTTVSIEKKWLNGWSAAATFEGEFSAVTNSYAGKGVVRYVW